MLDLAATLIPTIPAVTVTLFMKIDEFLLPVARRIIREYVSFMVEVE